MEPTAITATITVEEFIEATGIACPYPSQGEFSVDTSDIYRPGMQCMGFFKHFVHDRVQLFGNSEMDYLRELPYDVCHSRLSQFFSYNIPAVVVCQGHPVPPLMQELANRKGVPIFTTSQSTTRASHTVSSYLDERLSPCVTRHGGLLEIHGVGVMIAGESGIGKSEIALELVKQGHILVADDVVEVRKIGDNQLSGSAPPLVRYMMEARGIGIIDVRSMYGIGAVLQKKTIDLIIILEEWAPGKEYDRLGVDYNTTEVLGVAVPTITIPVRPGRNLAIIVEAAAMNYRLKRLGYDAAREFDRRLLEQLNS